jgi:tyrosyl-tRNA synthetase
MELFKVEKFNRIIRGTEEIVTTAELKELIQNRESFNFYYGTAPTGPFHIGYLIPLGKIVDLVNSNGKGTVLIADYHAYLDDRKTPWEELSIRSEYYKKCIELTLGDYSEKIKFVHGSEFQSRKEYIEDVFKLTSTITFKRAIRAASEVVRIAEEPRISSALYPIMQTVDVKHLGAEVVVGGIDQRHIYMLSREVLPEIDWVKPICIFTPLITSLKGPGTKMSASMPGTHIKIHEKFEHLEKLVMGAYCPPKVTEKNPIIEITKYIIFPFFDSFEIEREARHGGDIVYKDFDSLKSDYVSGKVHPYDLKKGVLKYLEKITSRVRRYFENKPDLMENIKKTYNWSEF